MAESKRTPLRGRCKGRQGPGQLSIADLRRAAKAKGATTFDPGIPCPRGHTSFRWTCGGGCIECGRISARAPGSAFLGGRTHNRTPPGTPNLKERRMAARDRGEPTFDPGVPCVRGHVSVRWTQSGICILCKRQNDNRYNAAHNLEHRARSKRSASARHEEVKAYCRRWARDNPEKVRANVAKRDGLKRGVQVGSRKAYAAYVLWSREAPSIPCYWCKHPTRPGERHRDHIIPLAKGGADSVANLCVSCPDCNHRKHAKLPMDFAGQGELRLA